MDEGGDVKKWESRWAALWEAMDAMQIGDPPLRWSVPDKLQARSLSVVASNRVRARGYRIKTFYDGGEMWIVRLPDETTRERKTWEANSESCSSSSPA